jgi:hypothetical protein
MHKYVVHKMKFNKQHTVLQNSKYFFHFSLQLLTISVSVKSPEVMHLSHMVKINS